MKKNIFIITHIKTNKRSFLSCLNTGSKPGIDVVLNIKKSIYFLGIKVTTIHRIARGLISENENIHNYIKVGDTIDLNEYSTLKVTKN